jgi:hypothetical protein
MTTIFDPPAWAFEVCLGCGRTVPLAAHELTCPCFDPRTRIAVAWICDHCDIVLDLVGLFTSWSAAIAARQDELDRRLARHLADPSSSQPEMVPTERRRNVVSESRRHITKQGRR